MKNPLDYLFVRDSHVCPTWCCFTFDNRLRAYFQDPRKILKDHVKQGDIVLDIGPGQGYFTLPMAIMVGEMGKVIAIDVQKKMLEKLMERARKQKVDNRIIPKLTGSESLEIEYLADFALAFWMVHEVRDQHSFLEAIYSSLKRERFLLIAEPKIHVTSKRFNMTLKTAQKIGFELVDRPQISFSHAVLLKKT